MAHESFEDKDVAAILNEHFVPIKVDREERPDIDQIYMNACMALNGSGGWPLTAILSPDQTPSSSQHTFPRPRATGRPDFWSSSKR